MPAQPCRIISSAPFYLLSFAIYETSRDFDTIPLRRVACAVRSEAMPGETSQLLDAALVLVHFRAGSRSTGL